MTTSTRRRPQFHPLTVAKVEKLTDDAVAVTFDIPDDLVEDYRFKPGQALTLRRVDGETDRGTRLVTFGDGEPFGDVPVDAVVAPQVLPLVVSGAR